MNRDIVKIVNKDNETVFFKTSFLNGVIVPRGDKEKLSTIMNQITSEPIPSIIEDINVPSLEGLNYTRDVTGYISSITNDKYIKLIEDKGTKYYHEKFNKAFQMYITKYETVDKSITVSPITGTVNDDGYVTTDIFNLL